MLVEIYDKPIDYLNNGEEVVKMQTLTFAFIQLLRGT